MKQPYNKQAFKNTQKKLLLTCLCMALIGIASVICALTIGKGLGFDKFIDQFGYQDPDAHVEISLSDDFGDDPKDYYGSYYMQKDYIITKVDISAEGVLVTASALDDAETVSYSVQYASQEYASDKFDLDSPLLILYQGDISSYILWSLKKDDGGAYYLEVDEARYMQTPITMEELLNDPADYQGTYYGTRDYGVECFDIDATDVTVRFERTLQAAAEQTYSYCFVPAGFAKLYLNRENDAILLYKENLKTIDRILWVKDRTNGTYRFEDDDQNVFTTETITTEQLLNDPKDYDGAYYSSSQYVISTFVLENGMLIETLEKATETTVTRTYQYQYLNEELAKVCYKSYNINGAVLAVYSESIDHIDKLLFLNRDENGNYSFEDQNGNEYGSVPITFAGLVNDPKNYYGVYTFNPQNKLTLNENQSAEFVLDGVAATYTYFYADQGWLSLYTSKGNYASAIVLYKEGMDGFYLFRIDENGNMVYGDMYTFVK